MSRTPSDAEVRNSRIQRALERATAEARRARTRHGALADSLCAALDDARERMARGQAVDELWIGTAVRDAARWSGDDELALLASLGAVARAVRASSA